MKFALPLEQSGWKDIWSHVLAAVLTVLNALDLAYAMKHAEAAKPECNPIWMWYLQSGHSITELALFKAIFLMFSIAWILLLNRRLSRFVMVAICGYYLHAVMNHIC